MNKLIIFAFAMSLAVVTRAADNAPPDLTSRIAAIKSFAKAVDDGDAAQAKKCIDATTRSDQALTNAGVGYLVAIQKLEKAVDAKFGENAHKSLEDLLADATPAGFIDQIVNYPDTIKEIQENDKPAVEVNQMQLYMKQVDGDWKISVADMTAEMGTAEKLAMMAAFVGPTSFMNDFLAEVKDGKYKDVDELKEALKTKLAAAKQKPATRAATRP